MDALTTLLMEIKKSGLAKQHLIGFFHVLIGRRITLKDGTLVSAGLSWRDLSNMLKKLRWEPELVDELGIKEAELPPRDRQRFWYLAITRAQVNSAEASAAGDRFAAVLKKRGYEVSPAPGR
jgi:hypothetical protein